MLGFRMKMGKMGEWNMLLPEC